MVDDKKIPQNRIAELRRENNLSQAELAKKTGLTRQAISLYEIGKREPKLTTWVKLADYFDVPLTYIQGLENNRVTSDDDFKKIMQFTLSHSSPKDLKNNLMYLDKIHSSLSKDKDIKNSVNIISIILNMLSMSKEEIKEIENILNNIDDTETFKSLVFNLRTAFKIIVLGETKKNKLAVDTYNSMLHYMNLYELVENDLATFDSEKHTIILKNEQNKKNQKEK
ncbi:hypothetical protein C5O77_01650 [Limosilactobacillus reuteri]|uniref:Uncharacterized protein n=2 Tax=Limosilactobacillus reuteri TaxID=1598 RepID=A0A3M6SG68_LIMRT|nr:helix-turn-helix transcriptional regulator [Limosilactobacillus reuteri]MBC8744946.1 helix-turn-helix transcriptional regulator [Lactobacillus sp. Marseille-P7033]NGC78491.1 helix-turn-helix transcriptional regulator [Limosilactobacillus reuteri]RMX26358.1 hypothetical protein C5O77_01650 [Limosilactobacillus reuteri]